MKLTGRLSTTFQQALVSRYQNYGALAQFVTEKLEAHLNEIYPNTAGIGFVVSELIGWANERSGKIHQLVTAAVEDRQDNDKLAAFYIEYARLRENVPDDPYDICWFPHSKPFVNRTRFRKALRDLTDPRLLRGLVVGGGPRTGKSYSKELVDFLQFELGGFESIYINLCDNKTLQPDDVVKRILRQMGKDQPVSSLEAAGSLRRWALDLAGIVQNAAVQTNKTWWIILDEFRKSVLEPGVTELAEELAELLGSGNPPLRLILINYTGVIPNVVRNRFDREDIAPLSRTDVRDFFKQFFRQDPGTDPDIIDMTTSSVWIEPAASPEAVEVLTGKIERKVKDLLSARGRGMA